MKNKEILALKEITREQINNALNEVNEVLASEVGNLIAENVKRYQETFLDGSGNNQVLEQGTFEMAVLFTAIQYSNETMRGVLTKLLCDKEEE